MPFNYRAGLLRFWRGLAVKKHSPAQLLDLAEFRQRILTSIPPGNPDLYTTYDSELKPHLDGLEAKYANQIPIEELAGLQELVKSKLMQLEARRREIVDHGAKEGAMIEVEALRQRLEDSKAAYTGPDRDAYVKQLDRLLESIAAKYGDRIPVDHAYELMQKLEAGLYAIDEEP